LSSASVNNLSPELSPKKVGELIREESASDEPLIVVSDVKQETEQQNEDEREAEHANDLSTEIKINIKQVD